MCKHFAGGPDHDIRILLQQRPNEKKSSIFRQIFL